MRCMLFLGCLSPVIPVTRHIGKESGKTNHIERFNNTLAENLAWLEKLYLFQKLENHIEFVFYSLL